MAARRIHQLPGIGWQAAVAGNLVVGLRQDLRRRLLDRNTLCAGHPLATIAPRSRAALFGLLDLGPLLGALANDANDVIGHVAGSVTLLRHYCPRCCLQPRSP